jgi:RimJ/RimL family protein N-acetyltransferase
MNKYKLDVRNIFIHGKTVKLCSLSKNEIENTNWFSWFNNENTCFFTQKHYYPNTIEKQLKFLDEIENNTNIIVLGIIYNDLFVGVCSLNEINYINRTCSISIFIGEKIKDENVAMEAIFLLLKHAFYSLNLNKVKMGQHVHLKLFFTKLSLAFGFKKEGISRSEIYKNGKYFDVINSSVLKSEFNEKYFENLKI